MSSSTFLSRHGGRWTTVMIIGHIAALIFGLAGLLIAVPNPQLWADSEMGLRAYNFGMTYAGGLHIVFATAAMLLLGIRFLGVRRTLWFLAIACTVSLSAELIGTTTGFPFGDYRYTSGLGYKILGEVPFTIPLSWFYMGLASYLLGLVLAGTGAGWRRSALAVLTGAALLTIWDLVLDPAMAHEQLEVRFWTWEQGGLYFDMPAQNFLGWLLTGGLFMGISRAVWGSDPPLTTQMIRVSWIIYLANLVFAMVISAAVGLWWPILLTILLGVVPATIALVSAEGWTGGSSGSAGFANDDTVRRVSRGVMTTGARMFLARDARLTVDGLRNVPESGPVLLLSRHYHHLLDGCALQVTLPRPMHVVVAIDWAKPGWQRRLLEFACRAAGWPVVVRPDSPGAGSFSSSERSRYLRSAFRESVTTLAEGRILTVFPEGYPAIDPHRSDESRPDTFLPFDPGFASIARAAERRSGLRIPLVPVGLDYAKDERGIWEIQLRFGAPVYLDHYATDSSLARDIALRVEALSSPVTVPGPVESEQLSESS
jgi:uncharacterized membrane protein/1-acyl-sn-glycerol-3-phosphate acyltransferase